MSSKHSNSRRGRLIATAAAAALAIVGCTAIGIGIWGNPSPPQPPASAATPTAQPDPGDFSARHVPYADKTGPTLAASTPTRVDIPAIKVDSRLMKLGLNDDGTMQVPALGKSSPAGWYTGSPTPGQLGPAVILGHVDSVAEGPSVFYRLGDVRPGDKVSVTRADHTVAVFQVDRVAEYPKDDFPTLAVFGNTDHAALRLMTCGGVFNRSTGHYLDNIVVYASLVSSHHA